MVIVSNKMVIISRGLEAAVRVQGQGPRTMKT